jgi:probable phosphoglycerate mutase
VRALPGSARPERIAVPSRFLYLVRHGEADDDGFLTRAGREQATLTGQRLSGVRFAAVRHSPLARAEETAELIADFQPGVPVAASGLLGDYPPPAGGPPPLPDAWAEFYREFPEDEREDGAELARAALARFAGPGESGGPGGAAGGGAELIVTHNFLIGWFLRAALDAPAWRWLGLNQCNCGITVLLYRTGSPDCLVSYNDVGHLPPELRWTGFPAALVPPLR